MDDEKRIYDKYIRPGRRLLSRIKTRFIIAFRSKRIKTIKDVEYLDYALFIKLLCVFMLCVLLWGLALSLTGIYFWFFPQVRPQDPAPFQPYIIPMIAKAVRGVINV